MALIDCYTELLAYTGYLLKVQQQKPVGHEEASKNYRALIARGEECAKARDYTLEQWRGALFPVCAWIDEAVLCSQWPEKAKWEHAQLQRQYFHTTTAGSEFFQRLEGLGENEGELRKVYAYCLALGFRGIYYLDRDLQKLREIGARNLQELGEDIAPLLQKSLFPEAYEATPTTKRRKRRKWRKLSPFSVCIFLLPIFFFVGLFALYDDMLSDETSAYLGLDIAPLYKSGVLRGKIPKIEERLGTTPSHEKQGEKAHGEKKSEPHHKSADLKKLEHPAAGGHYTVMEGDTLASISAEKKVYGDPLKWPVLYRHNMKELSELKADADLPEKPLHPGLKLKTVTHKEYRANLKKRGADLWVVNILSTVFNEKAVQAAAKVIQMEYPAYITKAQSQGKEWTRLRVGFYKNKASADQEGKKIQDALRLPEIWTTKVSQKEFENYAGY